jgi:hypothetical protein
MYAPTKSVYASVVGSAHRVGEFNHRHSTKMALRVAASDYSSFIQDAVDPSPSNADCFRYIGKPSAGLELDNHINTLCHGWLTGPPRRSAALNWTESSV